MGRLPAILILTIPKRKGAGKISLGSCQGEKQGPLPLVFPPDTPPGFGQGAFSSLPKLKIAGLSRGFQGKKMVKRLPVRFYAA
jgi:hypothetical protein